MSLHSIIGSYEPPLRVNLAYKVFLRVDGELRFPHWTPSGEYAPGTAAVEYGVWLKAVPASAPTIRGKSYLAGFHVFPLRHHAERWSATPGAVVVPVMVRGTRLEGLHCPEGQHQEPPGLRVWISDELLVPMERIEL